MSPRPPNLQLRRRGEEGAAEAAWRELCGGAVTLRSQRSKVCPQFPPSSGDRWARAPARVVGASPCARGALRRPAWMLGFPAQGLGCPWAWTPALPAALPSYCWGLWRRQPGSREGQSPVLDPDLHWLIYHRDPSSRGRGCSRKIATPPPPNTAAVGVTHSLLSVDERENQGRLTVEDERPPSCAE